jgi:hypothetical protein
MCENKEKFDRMGKKKTNGICGDGSQKFGPNLPLSEANLKIVEGGNSGISDVCTMGLLMSRDHKFARARQTHKKWKADSASMEHAPQVGLGSSPIVVHVKRIFPCYLRLYVLLIRPDCHYMVRFVPETFPQRFEQHNDIE